MKIKQSKNFTEYKEMAKRSEERLTQENPYKSSQFEAMLAYDFKKEKEEYQDDGDEINQL